MSALAAFVDGLSVTVRRDALFLLCGDRLGGGIGRDTYVFGLDETKVIKFENGARSFQNITEFNTWNELRDTPHAKWLAPVRHISGAGTVLVMDRTEPLRKGEGPERLPSWLGDVHLDNFGMLNGRVVCHDYGYLRALTKTIRARMRKVNWV